MKDFFKRTISVKYFDDDGLAFEGSIPLWLDKLNGGLIYAGCIYLMGETAKILWAKLDLAMARKLNK